MTSSSETPEPEPMELYERSPRGTARVHRFPHRELELPTLWYVCELIDGRRTRRHVDDLVLHGVEPSEDYSRAGCEPYHDFFVYWAERDASVLPVQETVKLCENVAPQVGVYTRPEAVRVAALGIDSQVSRLPAGMRPRRAAGIVAFPLIPIFTEQGDMIWWSFRSTCPLRTVGHKHRGWIVGKIDTDWRRIPSC